MLGEFVVLFFVVLLYRFYFCCLLLLLLLFSCCCFCFAALRMPLTGCNGGFVLEGRWYTVGSTGGVLLTPPLEVGGGDAIADCRWWAALGGRGLRLVRRRIWRA